MIGKGFLHNVYAIRMIYCEPYQDKVVTQEKLIKKIYKKKKVPLEQNNNL